MGVLPGIRIGADGAGLLGAAAGADDIGSDMILFAGMAGAAGGEGRS